MSAADDTGRVNLRWSQALVSGLVSAGLRHLVLSPGSRSSALALAFLRQADVRCHVLLDERSAAFFALGVARRGGEVVGLLCTSGSAAGNWYPAVIEAALAGVPLLLLSAARPAEVTGWGANQTLDQNHLFGQHVRSFHAPPPPADDFDPAYLQHLAVRAVAECRWPLPGPVHLNLAFREPLLPVDGSAFPQGTPCSPRVSVAQPQLLPDAQVVTAAAAIFAGQPGAIVCGGADYPGGFADAVTALAAQLDCPLLAEPLSNLRFGCADRSRLCVRYDTYFRCPDFRDALSPAWILRFGAYPVVKSLQSWLAAAGARQIVVTADSRWPDPEHRTEVLIQADPKAFCTALAAACGQAPAASRWRSRFAAAEAEAERLCGPYRQCENFEGALIPTLLADLPSNYALFCGNSLPIRDLDTFSGSADKPLRLFANRGASGIDGNLSTALGVATGGPSVAIVGDLSAQHDLTALAAAAGRDVVIVVINNGGGGIFEYLPVAGLPEFERAWLTPQTVDLVTAARSFGVPAQRARSLAEFAGAFCVALRRGGPTLIEVVVDRRQSVALHREFERVAMSTAWPS